jgi:mRNA-degrading endonuclease RelE of RelBE toxin-antitoxin system
MVGFQGVTMVLRLCWVKGGGSFSWLKVSLRRSGRVYVIFCQMPNLSILKDCDLSILKECDRASRLPTINRSLVDIKPLKGRNDWRLRVRDYRVRVIFIIDNENKVYFVTKIVSRINWGLKLRLSNLTNRWL